ncbi:MAG: hypothetical protein AAFP03_08865 [Cyanobacteria bacterium J06598_3]
MADVSGAWLGTYWQQDEAVRFEMTLVQSGNTISGRVLDDNYLGEASLAGTASGRAINFTKTYTSSARHSISYTGTVSEEGDRMVGHWQISYLSGTWSARKSDDNLSVQDIIKQASKVPMSVQ